MTSAGNPITLDLKTKYVVKGIGAEKTVASIVEIWVDENGSGKIEKVQDKWDGEINEGPFKQVCLAVFLACELEREGLDS